MKTIKQINKKLGGKIEKILRRVVYEITTEGKGMPLFRRGMYGLGRSSIQELYTQQILSLIEELEGNNKRPKLGEIIFCSGILKPNVQSTDKGYLIINIVDYEKQKQKDKKQVIEELEGKKKVHISVFDAHYLKGHLETLIKFQTTVHNEEEWNIFLSKQFSNYNNLLPAKKMLYDLKKSIKKTEALTK